MSTNLKRVSAPASQTLLNDGTSSAVNDEGMPKTSSNETPLCPGASARLAGAPASAVAYRDVLWLSDKTVLTVEFLNGTKWQQSYVKAMATKHYHGFGMRLRFEFLGANADRRRSDIRIEFACDPNDRRRSWSCVGTGAERHPNNATMWLNIPLLEPTIPKECQEAQADVLHELAHGLGLEHEHCHPNCNINWSKWAQGEIVKDHSNYGKIQSLDGVVCTSYDKKSITHYPVHWTETTDRTWLPLNIELSEGDKDFLRVLYSPGVVAEQGARS